MMSSYGEQLPMGQNGWPGLTLRQLLGKVDLFAGNRWGHGEPGGKAKELEDWGTSPTPQSAFLGPQIWDKKISMSAIENEMGWNQGYNQQQRFNIENETPSPSPPQIPHQQQYHHPAQYSQQQPFPPMPEYNLHQQQQAWTKQEFRPKEEHEKSSIEFKVSDSDLALATVPGANFDPKNRAFSPEELKPQPIIRKRKKIFTPEGRKDGKYWEKRCKNNVAARRSREARRLKENQIALRAAYLEKQNMHLRVTLKSLNIENASIRVSVETLMAKIKEKEKERNEKKRQA